MPDPPEEWILTEHVEKRMKVRGITEEAVRQVLALGVWMPISRAGRGIVRIVGVDVRLNPQLAGAIDLVLVVEPGSRRIITAFYLRESDPQKRSKQFYETHPGHPYWKGKPSR